MHHISSNTHFCLIMEQLDGESLGALWPVFDNNEKSHHFYGSVEKGPAPHHLFHKADTNPAICGPFDSESEFDAVLAKRIRAIWAVNGKHGSNRTRMPCRECMNPGSLIQISNQVIF